MGITVPPRLTQNQKLAAYLRARPGEWLPMPELARVITPTGVGAAVHSRIADLRRLGMTIRHKSDRGAVTRLCRSFYFFEPAEGDSVAATGPIDPFQFEI